MASEEEEANLASLADALNEARHKFFDCRPAWQKYAVYYKSLVDQGKKDKQAYLDELVKQLRVPCEGIAETFQDYSAAVTAYDNEHYEDRLVEANKIYQTCLAEVEARRPFELELKNSSYSVAAYDAYIDWQTSRTRFTDADALRDTVELIDRAIARDPSSPQFWLKLYYFLVKSKDQTVLAQLSFRMRVASEACPNNLELSACIIRIVTRVDLDPQEVLIFYEGLSKRHNLQVDLVFATFAGLRYLDELHDVDHQESHASKFIEQLFKKHPRWVGQNYRVAKLLIPYQDAREARRLWQSMARLPENMSLAAFWLDYFHWEMSQQNYAAARNLIKTGCLKTLDAPSIVYDAALDFEHMYGSCDDYDKTLAVITKARKLRIEEAQSRIVSAQLSSEESKDNNKRKFQSEDAEEETVDGKRQKVSENTKGRNREKSMVIVRGCPVETTEADVADFFEDCGSIVTVHIVDDSTAAGGFALVEFAESTHVKSALEQSNKELHGRRLAVRSAENTMLFVTNYPASIQKQDIVNLFKPHGSVLDVRLPSLMYDHSRRFAYVQMSCPEEAQSALSMNDSQPFEADLKLSVALSNPNLKHQRTTAAVESREIFIKRVSWDATEQHLRDAFAGFGTIVSLRLPAKFSTVHHDGICFIEFESPEAAKRALGMNGSLVQGMALEVSLSKPRSALQNKRPAPAAAKKTTTTTTTTTENQHTEKPVDPAVIQAKTLGIMNLPDTVSEAQLRAVFEVHGALRKIELRPNHAGALVEFNDPTDAGRASLALNGTQFDGREIQIGRYEDLMKQASAQVKNDEKSVKPTSMVPRKVRSSRPLPMKSQSLAAKGAVKTEQGAQKEAESAAATTTMNDQVVTDQSKKQDYFRSLLG